MTNLSDPSAGANRIAGTQRCLFGTSAENHCGEPAVIHVLLSDGAATMSCTKHARWESRDHQDSHPIGGACGLPGTTWRLSQAGEPGHCIVEGVEHSVGVASPPALPLRSGAW